MKVNYFKPKDKNQIIKDLSNLSQEEKNEKLIRASENSHKDIVELLIEAGADVNVINKYGDTALIRTSNVNVKNNYGDTALTCDSSNGHKEIVELLIKAGAINENE